MTEIINRFSTLIIIPFALPWDWNADYERETAFELSKTNCVIAFLIGEGMTLRNLITKPQKILTRLKSDLFVFRPIYIIPLQRIPIIRSINYRLAVWQLRLFILSHTFQKLNRVVYWTFSLQYSVYPDQFPERSLAVYDCVDSFTSADKIINSVWQIAENRILRGSDFVFTNQKTLFRRMKTKHRRVFQVPVGFSHKLFRSSVSRSIPVDLDQVPRPRIGFVGNISNRIDFEFLTDLIRSTPGFHYIFIGKDDPNFTVPDADFHANLSQLKAFLNVYFLGPKRKSEIPAYIRHLDIGLIPYDVKQNFNLHSFPMKALEFAFMGKPVVTTRLPELTILNEIFYPASSVVDAKRIMRSILSNKISSIKKRQMKMLAVHNSWTVKIRTIRNILSMHTVIHI